MGRSITLMYEEAKTHQHKRKWERINGIALLILIVLLCISVSFGIYKDVTIYRKQQATLAELDQVVADMHVELQSIKEED